MSQLVLAVAFFKGIFWNSEFDKNYMTSNMFCSTMMSLVISRLSCFRLAEIRRKGSTMKVLFYLLSSWLSPNRTSVFSFWIQMFPLITNNSRSASLEPCKFTSLSMMMNLACLLKLCPFSWKCLQARMELGFLVSFLWLFNLRLNAVSAFPTYCILHNMHSIRPIRYSLLQLRLKKMLMFVLSVGSWMCLFSALGCNIKFLYLINMECIFVF